MCFPFLVSQLSQTLPVQRHFFFRTCLGLGHGRCSQKYSLNKQNKTSLHYSSFGNNSVKKTDTLLTRTSDAFSHLNFPRNPSEQNISIKNFKYRKNAVTTVYIFPSCFPQGMRCSFKCNFLRVWVSGFSWEALTVNSGLWKSQNSGWVWRSVPGLVALRVTRVK